MNVCSALSPTPPYPQNRYRFRLAAVLAPVIVISQFVTPYMLAKGATFGMGFAFFGDPLITRGITLLNQKFPNWMALLDLRK